MQLTRGALFALALLPALGMARLRPHVKRQASFHERALDSGLDDCEGDTPPAQTIPPIQHRHKKPKQTSPPQYGSPVHQQNPPTSKGVPTVIPGISPETGTPSKGGLLEANTKHPGFIIGSAVRASQLDGSMDKCILGNLNLLVPEYEGALSYRRLLFSDSYKQLLHSAAKSDKIEPQSNHWVTSPVDTIVAYTKEHGISFKTHTLLFDQVSLVFD